MERFFIQCFSIGEVVEVEELILRRYSNIDYILSMDYKEGVRFINCAKEKELEEKVWQRWLVDYRLMDKDSFTSFEEYMDIIRGKKSSNNQYENMSAEDIEAKVKSIIDLTL